MKNLKDIISEKLEINEKLIINKNIKIHNYNYQPKNRRELIDIVSNKYKDLKDKNEVLDLNDIDVKTAKNHK